MEAVRKRFFDPWFWECFPVFPLQVRPSLPMWRKVYLDLNNRGLDQAKVIMILAGQGVRGPWRPMTLEIRERI
jgi:hypothetical protein